MKQFDFIYVDDPEIKAKDSDFALCSYSWRDEIWMPHKHCKEINNAIVLTEKELRGIILSAIHAGQNNIDQNGNYIGVSAEDSAEYIYSLNFKTNADKSS